MSSKGITKFTFIQNLSSQSQHKVQNRQNQQNDSGAISASKNVSTPLKFHGTKSPPAVLRASSKPSNKSSRNRSTKANTTADGIFSSFNVADYPNRCLAIALTTIILVAKGRYDLPTYCYNITDDYLGLVRNYANQHPPNVQAFLKFFRAIKKEQLQTSHHSVDLTDLGEVTPAMLPMTPDEDAENIYASTPLKLTVGNFGGNYLSEVKADAPNMFQESNLHIYKRKKLDFL